MLRHLMSIDASLIDYECVKDEAEKRLIFFGVQAGQAGMVNTLWSYGKRLEALGEETIFGSLKQALDYPSLNISKEAIRNIGQKIRDGELAESEAPFICGITGYGRVSEGAQDVLDVMDPVRIAASDICKDGFVDSLPKDRAYKLVFREEDLVELKPEFATERSDTGAGFDLQDYYNNPAKYTSIFDKYLPYLSVLVNAVYWTPDYDRFVPNESLIELLASSKSPKLVVIGDVTCDIDGSIQATVKAATPDNPVFVFNPTTEEFVDGFSGDGMQMMTVDILPTEIPRESTEAFGDMLLPYVLETAKADFSSEFESLHIPEPMKKALIVHDGELTNSYEYIKHHLNSENGK